MKKFLLLAVSLAAFALPAFAGSTINPAVPAANSPLQSAPIRANFAAAYTDVNNLLSKFGASVAPTSPTTFQDWINTSNNPYIWSIYDGAQWVQVGTIDAVTHVFAPANPCIFANPTATIGAAPVNGSAPTCMRSDAAPPLPSTLPALNGSLLTALNPANLTTTGTPSSSTYLRGDYSWQPVVGGVASVFGRTGAVVAAPGDYSVGDVTGAAPLASPTFTGTVTIPNGGILGTPASGNAVNMTGYTVGNLAGLAAGVGTFLATPSSANLAAALTDETGTGASVFANGPTLIAPVLGTPASGDASNLTNFPAANLSGLGTGVASALAANVSGTGAICLASGSACASGNANFGTATGNVVGHIVTMANTTTGIQDSGISMTAIPTNNLATALNAKTGAYTIATTDAGKINYLNNASPFTFTVPTAATLGAGFATDLGNIGAGLLSNALASGTWADTGNATITTVAGQELYAWVDAGAAGVHSWVSSPPLVAHGIVANNTANKDYGTSFNNSNVTALLAGNLGAVNAANNWTAQQSNCITTLTISTATFTPDGTCNNYIITLVHASCPCTLANPSGGFASGSAPGWLKIVQSATGTDTITTWGSSYISPGGTASIALSTAPNAIDIFSIVPFDSTHIELIPGGLNATH